MQEARRTMSNTGVMGICTVALFCIEYASDRGIIHWGGGFLAAAIAFALLGKAIRRRMEGKH